ncbi:zinc finger protein 37 homolog [Musca vetustissima]|uniref:zinc finger protein 37 homolog n=1 Tax=Musca vetustissima TaxID=27455 RepID=UPI002AB6A8B3|nr:zinc finger protein 37 homolog [Musca vetustissima]
MEDNRSNLFPLNEMCRTCAANTNTGANSKTAIKCIYEPLNGINSCAPPCPTIIEILIKLEPQIEIGFLDSLPKIVCLACVEQLQKTHTFLTSYRQANEKLEKLLKCIQSVEEAESLGNEAQLDDNEFGKANVDSEDCDNNALEGSIENHEDHSLSDGLVHMDCEEINDSSSDTSWKESTYYSYFYFSSDLLMETLPIPKKRTKKKMIQKATKDIIDASKNNLDSIEEASQKNADETYTCQECKMVLNDLKKWKQHMRTEHKTNKTRNLAFENHVRTHTGNTLFMVNKITTHYIAILSIVFTTGEKPYLCVECGKRFKTGSNLHIHMLRHKGEKNLQCPECPKKYVCKSDLYCHMLIHKKEKPFVCSTCRGSFLHAYLLRQHSVLHTGEKNFPCTQCSLRTKLLKSHMITHSGVKPYACPYCDRAFAQSGDCNKHIKQHIGENIYQCELCPLRFPLARDLRTHFATHKVRSFTI